MGILGWLVLGLIAGAIAKALHKGDEPGGVLGTLAVGVLGALIGGFVASAIGIGSMDSFFSIGTWLIAIVGAFVLLLAFDAMAGSSRRDRGVGA